MRHERYSVLRIFEGGLLERVVGGIELQEHPAGTVIQVLTQMTHGMPWRACFSHCWVAKLFGMSCATVKPLSRSAAQAVRAPIRAPVPAHLYRTHLRVRLQHLAQMPIQQDLMAPCSSTSRRALMKRCCACSPTHWQRHGTAPRGKSCACFSTPPKSVSSR